METTVINKQAGQVTKSGSGWREFYAGEHVMVCDVRNGLWLSGTIAERHGPKSYVVSLDDGQVWKRHVDHIQRLHWFTSGSAQKQEPFLVSDPAAAELPQWATAMEASAPASAFLPANAEASSGSGAVPASQSVADRPPLDMPTEASVTPAPDPAPVLRRSSRVIKKPERLIEQI